jgi:hypothetical protein
MATTVFTSTIVNSLRETLTEVIDDSSDGVQGKTAMRKWMDEFTMEHAYEDDLEMGGPGLAAEKPEGAAISIGSVREGYLKRYIARTFGLELQVTEEAVEDCKYAEVIEASKRLKRAMWKTVDVDSAMVLVRGFSTSYLGADGQSLWSSTHTLPNGGTFSNLMSVPMSPSRAAVIILTSQIRKMPGHDGITEGYEPVRILCPTEQWAVWTGLVKSEKSPEAGQFNEINVVNSELDLEVLPLKFWDTTTTNYAIQTDAPGGFKWGWRRKPKSTSWVNNAQTILSYAVTARWDRGWTDARCSVGVNA